MTNSECISVAEGISLTNNLIDKTLLAATGNFYPMAEHLSKTKGKGIRTQLLLASSVRADGKTRYAAAKAAAAVELLHMATLVHDDVIDNAPIRRGLETVHAKFGTKEAVICGDYLLCLAMELLYDLAEEDFSEYRGLLKSMTRALGSICEGELTQHLQNKNLNLSVYEYLRIISGKTAALFYISAYSGAILSGCGSTEAKGISRFGKYLGVMFQMLDDCKDFEMSEEQVKKPVKNDVAEGVVTLPLILAMRKNGELRSMASRIMAGDSSAYGVASLIKMVIDTGSLQDTRLIINRYRLKAEKSIVNIQNPYKREYFTNILEQLQKSI